MIDGKLLQTDKEICSVEIKAEREDCRMDVPGNVVLLYEKIYFPK